MKNTENELLRQLIITEKDSLIFVNQNNLKDSEEMIDMLLKGTATTIQSLFPNEFKNEFIEVYIELLKDLVLNFDNYYKQDINISNDEILKQSETILQNIKNCKIDSPEQEEEPFSLIIKGHD